MAFVLEGVNGNLYYQFSDPTGAFRGFQQNGQPSRFRGNPFTINDPVELNCGFSDCSTYFGGGLARVHIRFTAYDGDTQPGGFDENDISLILNGTNVGSWSGLTTEATNTSGTTSFGFGTGFGNNTFDTGWFTTTNGALLNNILTTGQTTTQVLDDDPNDNYWDFRRGPTLTNPDIVTVAPGYTLDKTADGGVTSFSAVGDTVDYTYVVTNIGSVPIRQLSLVDDKIASVSCDKTVIQDTNPGGVADFATCTGTYTITQEDIDRGTLTNIAIAEGVPDFGTLGALRDEVTLAGPAAAPALFFEKTSSLTEFGNAGTSVPYSFFFRNDGNVTLSNVQINDPLLPGLVCNVPDLEPDDTFTCTGSYTVQQSDVDDYAADTANTLDNTATVNATPARGPPVSETSSVSLPAATVAPAMGFEKEALASNFDEAGDIISYRFTITNEGNVTFPAPPVVNDPSVGAVSCPGGPIAPNNSIICSASYTVTQDDIDLGEFENTATATITVAGVNLSETDSVTVPAVRTTGLEMVKRLAAASPTSFDAPGIGLLYEYDLTNTGNVRLLTPSVSDDKVTVSCAATEILPGQTVTCTSANYSTVQSDVNQGGVTNIATASATEAGPTANIISSDPQSLTVPSVQNPAISLVKTAPVVTAPDFQVGQTITYTFDVTNTGNVRIASGTIGVDEITITDDKIGTFTCFATPLNRGQTQSCTADYVLTNDDIVAGTVINTATASAGTTDSPQVTAQVSPNLSPGVTVAKVANTASVSATTDSISYTFTVTNSGDTQILLPDQPITINDALLTGVADCSSQPATLNPGDSFTCSGVRNGITQDELDAGQVDNMATASFPFTNGSVTITVTSDEDTATVPVVAAPGMIFSKTGPATFNVGETLTYTFSVQNTGNVTLVRVPVTDPLIPGLSCVLSDIAPGTTQSCTGGYAVTQADVDAETIVNTATATPEPSQGTLAPDTDGHTTNLLPGAGTKSASISKTADRASIAAVGEQVTYSFAVQNTGTQTLSNLAVTDPLVPGFSCAIPSLAPGVTDTSCSVIYTVTQADIDRGEIENTATVDSAEIAPATGTETIDGPARNPELSFDKIASGGYTAAGDTVDFVFRVQNSGNVTLTNVIVTDTFFSPTFTCTIPSLAPGAVDNTSCTTSYTVLQSNVDDGSFTNTAQVSGTGPTGAGDPTPVTDTEVVSGPAENASLSVDKVSTDGSFAGDGDSEVYNFTVTNTGNVTLSNLTLTDADLGFSCPLPDLLPGASTTQCADASPLQATKTFDQGDVDALRYTNTVSVTGESDSQGTAVSATDEETVTGPAQVVDLLIDKSTAFAGTVDAVGQTIDYSYEVTNNGNITLTAAISVSDDKISSVTCPALPLGGLLPGDSITCIGTYTVEQADLDTGSVTNIASATITQPVVPVNPGDTGFVTETSPTDSVTVGADQMPDLRIAKRVKPGTTSSYAAEGDVVTFEYTVTNIGNVTTTDPITVEDDQIAGTLTCSAAPLPPNGSVICEQDWVADQADINAGSVTNIATGNTLYDGVLVTSDPRSVTVNAVQTPSLAINKTFISTDAPGFFNEGDELTYEIVVTNDGNVTVDAPITLTDSLTTPVCPPVAGGVLDPGDTLTCSATHIVTANDIALGAATNVVFATGTFDGTPVQSPSDDAIYPVDAQPALSLVKTPVAGTSDFSAVGETIIYDYAVTNSGNVGLVEAITIEDDVIGTIACRPGGTALPSGDTFTCQGSYVVTQADLDRGFITNNATAQTTFGSGADVTDVVSPNADATVPAAENEALDVVKEMTSNTTPVVGSILPYRIVATNSGNQTLSGVSIEDPLIPVLTCEVVPAVGPVVPAPVNVVLAPNDALRCTGNYTVTQADIDAQEIVNTATANGTDPQGETVDGTATNTQAVTPPVTTMNVLKEIVPAPILGTDPAFSQPGQQITFRVTVTNTGNITLQTATITDDRTVVPTSCTVGPIAPGASDNSCEFTYTVTQADVDVLNTDGTSFFGGFTNIARVSAVPNNPDLPVIEEEDDVFVRGPEREPGISLVKDTAATGFSSLGEIITYTFTIGNTGNVTLTEAPEIVDDKIGTFTCAGFPNGGLAPLAFYTCSADYAVTQADLDAGFVTNVATADSSEVDPATDTATVTGTETPALVLTKSAQPSGNVPAGTEVIYTYTVENTGNQTLTNVAVTDQHTGSGGTVALTVSGDALEFDAAPTGDSTDASANGVWDELRPGDIARFTASYTVTQEDVDTQTTLSNTATVTANPPGAAPPETDQTTVTVTPEVQAPELTAIKLVDATGLSTPPELGETIGFDISVENTGNQTLRSITLADTLRRVDGTIVPIATPDFTGGDTGIAGALEVGETWTYRATHVITQEDLDAGGLTNQVVARARAPDGTFVQDASDDGVDGNGSDNPTPIDLPAEPGIETTKTVASGVAEVGELVTFEVTVQNTGNVTLTDVNVSDDLRRVDGIDISPDPAAIFNGADAGSGQGTLLPDETATYVVTYRLTQEDVDAGGLSNTATGQGTPPGGAPETDVSDNGNDTDGNTTDDPTVFEVPADPAVTLTKALDPDGLQSFDAVGDVLTYLFTIENTGNVTLTGTPVVTDPLITDAGEAITCDALPSEGLAPEGTIECRGSYEVTQEDLDRGQIDNSATASIGTTATEDPATNSVPATQLPALELVKNAPSIEAEDFVTGLEVTYEFVVTNTGNVTITEPITIVDVLIPADDITCPAFPAEGIAPDGTYTCTGAYTVTADAVDLGAVTNVAYATDGTTESPRDSATIPNDGIPSLSIEKEADVSNVANVDDEIAYTFTVTNSGTRAFAAPVVVQDTILGPITCFTPSVDDPDFVAGEEITCSGTYRVTQEDLDRGEVLNEAYAETDFGADDTPVLSDPDSVTTPVNRNALLSLNKSAATLPVTAVDQVLTYTITARNDGNQTLRAVSVTDPLLSGFTCEAAVLAPGAELVCTGDYTVRQSDIDAGTLRNTARVAAIDPAGDPVGTSTVLDIPMPAASPGVSLTKTATPSPFGSVGSTLSYVFAVQNTGNVTLSDLTVTDPVDADFSCNIAVLEPDETTSVCAFDIVVTQAMVDDGEFSNTASVSGEDPFGTPVTGTDGITTPGPDRTGGLEATKIVLPSAGVAGQPVRFEVLVANTGNVTLDNIVLTDVMTRADSTPITLDAPFALIAASDTNGNGLLDVDETWRYQAERTLTQDDVNSGGISNQVTVDGREPDGTPVTDVSDDGDDSDGNTTDDPTIFDMPSAPALDVVKSVEVSGAMIGDETVFLITATNVGNVDLTDLVANDTLSRADGSVIGTPPPTPRTVPATLSPGDAAIWEVRHIITQEDIDAGGLSNTAIVTGTDPGGDSVDDVSQDADLTDGNTFDDPTILEITPAPQLEVIKEFTSAGSLVGEEVLYSIRVRNSGNVTVTGISIEDTVTTFAGEDTRSATAQFVSNSGPSPEGTLIPDETATFTVAVPLSLPDIDSGGQINVAVARGTSSSGAPVADVSDDDGVGADDPTRAPVAAVPSFDITKTAGEPVTIFPTVDQVSFDIDVTNTGNLTQTGIQVSDDLVAFLAPATLLNDTYPVQVVASGFTDGVANVAYDGEAVTDLLSGNPTLAPGETGTITVTLTFTTGSGVPGSPNTASVISTQLAVPTEAQAPVDVSDADGDGVPDRLESPTEDRDGDGIPDREDYDPTGYFYCEEDGRILTGGLISVSGGGFTQTGAGTSGPITIVQGGAAGFFQFHVTAPGTYTLGLTYPPQGQPSTDRTTLGTLDATSRLPDNPASIGSSERGSTGVLADRAAAANPFYTVFEFEAGDPFIINNNIPLRACGGARDVVASKTADRTTAVFGETINYTLTFRNETLNNYVNAQIFDRLPSGLIYTPNSAVVDGTRQEPNQNGATLDWTVTLPPSASITVTYSARVAQSGNFGPQENRTWMTDAFGRTLSNVASATVSIVPEHVFDCSDVIGKVFDDRNSNGYQDGPDNLTLVPDDNISGGKGKLLPSQPREINVTEPGIAGVRLVTPDGTLITTDQFGRFSVPCAALPKKIGSNFQLKLDTRTLPTGYRVTTENPRNIRLTAGKMAKMNFGASLSRVVNIDLSAAAFAANEAALTPSLTQAIRGLVGQIKDQPTTLRLTYGLASGEDASDGRARLRAVEKALQRAWRGQGNYKLIVEKTVTRASR